MLGRRATVSELATAINRLYDGLGESLAEMRGFGAPDECGDLIFAGHERDVLTLWSVSGWLPLEYEDEVKRRVTARWLYFDGWAIGQAVEVGAFESVHVGGPDPTTYLIDRLTGEMVG